MAALTLSPRLFSQDEEAPRQKRVVRPPSAPDVQAFGPIVKEIEIVYVGPKSVQRSVILANMRTTVGQPYSPASVEEDVRNLYATGFFTNLRISDEPLADGVKVVVIVQPKPLVKEIVIKGAEKIKEARVRKEVSIKLGDPLSEQGVAQVADRVKEYYQSKGYEKAQVNYKIDVNEEFGRAVITYNIVEGDRAFISDIEFKGNANIPSKVLRKEMKTKKKDIFTWFNKSGIFKDDQFKQDLKKIREFYQERGYIDMQIKDVQFEYPEKDRMKVVITVFEGIRYSVGKIRFAGATIFTEANIRNRMPMLEGAIFSPKGLEADIKGIQDLYGEKGYIDADVRPEREANVESGKIDLLFVIQEGPESYIQSIVIQGNNKTKDKVIRRELAVAPGEVYDSVLVDASKKRLENLGYFEKVDINPQDTNIPNRKNMIVTVEEKRTGSVSFGAGFSSVDSLLGFVEISQSNFDIANFPYFTGAGQKFRTRLQYGIRRQDATISFTEPWFLNQRLSLGIDLFARNSEFLNAFYSQSNIGGSIGLARALNPFWTASIKYSLQNIDLYDFQGGTPTSLLAEEGARSKSAVQIGFTYDTRDNVFLTRRGEKIDIVGEMAGGPFLGQTDIIKWQIDAQKFFPLPYDMILTTAASTGTVEGYDDTETVPLFERFFIGGARSVRGFDNREVGPKDSNGEPTGGSTFAYGTLELTFPIMDRVRGAVFVDAGFENSDAYNWTVEANSSSDGDGALAVGAGFGLRLNLPIGPLRLDLGFPVVHDRFNGGGPKFAFDVGYQF
jgi:outer membrane protein insertion porin family